MKLKVNQIFVILLLLMMLSTTSCGIFQKNNGTKFCGCPSHK
ncbi:hypothetical protein [Sediminibacterium soli]|nr:hypothetical protein [Sediminibacterium soli]